MAVLVGWLMAGYGLNKNKGFRMLEGSLYSVELTCV